MGFGVVGHDDHFVARSYCSSICLASRRCCAFGSSWECAEEIANKPIIIAGTAIFRIVTLPKATPKPAWAFHLRRGYDHCKAAPSVGKDVLIRRADVKQCGLSHMFCACGPHARGATLITNSAWVCRSANTSHR